MRVSDKTLLKDLLKIKEAVLTARAKNPCAALNELMDTLPTLDKWLGYGMDLVVYLRRKKHGNRQG